MELETKIVTAFIYTYLPCIIISSLLILMLFSYLKGWNPSLITVCAVAYDFKEEFFQWNELTAKNHFCTPPHHHTYLPRFEPSLGFQIQGTENSMCLFLILFPFMNPKIHGERRQSFQWNEFTAKNHFCTPPHHHTYLSRPEPSLEVWIQGTENSKLSFS